MGRLITFTIKVTQIFLAYSCPVTGEHLDYVWAKRKEKKKVTWVALKSIPSPVGKNPFPYSYIYGIL